MSLSDILLKQGDLDRARLTALAALETARDNGLAASTGALILLANAAEAAMELGRVDEAAALIDPAFDRPLRADDDRTLGILDQLGPASIFSGTTSRSRGAGAPSDTTSTERKQSRKPKPPSGRATPTARTWSPRQGCRRCCVLRRLSSTHLPGSCSPWRPEPARTSPTRADARTRRKPSTPSRGWPRWSPWRRAS